MSLRAMADMSAYPNMPTGVHASTQDATTEQELCDLLAGLSADDVHELATLAEAMHADGGK